MNSNFFKWLKKYFISICTDFFYSRCLVFSHKNISHTSLTCKSSWSNFLQQPASKSSFDHIQEVHVLVLSIRPRCKKNKSKFHFIYGKKTICCLDQHLKVDEIKDIYTSTILTEKNSSSEMQSDWKWSLFRKKRFMLDEIAQFLISMLPYFSSNKFLSIFQRTPGQWKKIKLNKITNSKPS